MIWLDPRLKDPITEEAYGDHCIIYDEARPEDPWHNVKGLCKIIFISIIIRLKQKKQLEKNFNKFLAREGMKGYPR